MAHAQEAFQSLGRLDIREKSTLAGDFLSASFHLEGISPYLLIDFDVFVGLGSQFTEGDAIEKPLVLFDRAGVVCFVKSEVNLAHTNRPERHQLARRSRS